MNPISEWAWGKIIAVPIVLFLVSFFLRSMWAFVEVMRYG